MPRDPEAPPCRSVTAGRREDAAALLIGGARGDLLCRLTSTSSPLATASLCADLAHDAAVVGGDPVAPSPDTHLPR